jgi:hypothetical protein
MADKTHLRPWLYLVLLVVLNAWICREAFVTQSTGHWYSMHGDWIAMARLVGLHWLEPRWWPYWGGGAPVEYAYAPLIPAATAVLGRLFHVSLPLAFHSLTGLVYCLGPALLYVASWRLFRAPGYSFAAALAYSLLSPAQLIVPDSGFHPADVLGARRMHLVFDWDDLPHLTSLALFPIAVLFLARALERRRWLDTCLATLTMAVMMLANMFGVVLVALATLTVPLAMERRFHPALFLRAALTAAAAYLAVCPWLPPSLLLSIRRMALLDGEADTLPRAFLALAVVGVVCFIVWHMASRVDEWPLRWLLLVACPAVLIPVLAQYWGPHFVLQPGRYKLELELVVAWLGVFALRPLIQLLTRRLTWRVRFALAIPLVVLAGFQAVSYCRIAKEMLRPVNVAASLEYRSAKWVEANLPGQRVMMTGSMASWLDAFTDQPQVVGQSYSTAMNPMEPVAIYTIYIGENAGDRDAQYSLLWLQALGTHAVAVPGPKSPDAWKPFLHPRKFEGVLPVLWREDDTTIYRVPQVSAELVHVMRPAQLVSHRPVHGLDVAELRTYVAALEDPSAPPATLEWEGPNRAVVRARLEPPEVISTQINYHPGWHARVAGMARRVYADGLGFMAIDPQCAGDCEIALEFDGGLESKICWGASAAVLLAGLVGFARKEQ